MLELFDLSTRTALVTGAGTGIGRALAVALAGAGARVALAARRRRPLEETAAEIAARGGCAREFVVDLEQRDGLEDFTRSVTDGFGAVDVLVNCAGINPREPFDRISFETWDKTLNVNLAVPFFLARLLVPHMKRNGWGRIINVASLQARYAFAHGMPYGASKGGVVQLTRAMAEAWSGDGINCNAIAPGFFPTELTRAVFDDPEKSTRAAARTAIGRNGEMRDLHGVVVFLASRASDYVTGQTIFVDGGFSVK